jgi:uncharacterized protein YjiS (DUF1127 family)
MNLFDDARFHLDTQPKILADLRHMRSLGRALLHRVIGVWAARRQRERDLHELYSFTEREFSDIGLSKSDLPAIEKGVYRRE